jgi:hypothetical protein
LSIADTEIWQDFSSLGPDWLSLSGTLMLPVAIAGEQSAHRLLASIDRALQDRRTPTLRHGLELRFRRFPGNIRHGYLLNGTVRIQVVPDNTSLSYTTNSFPAFIPVALAALPVCGVILWQGPTVASSIFFTVLGLSVLFAASWMVAQCQLVRLLRVTVRRAAS